MKKSIRFNFVGSNERSILLTDEDDTIDIISQEIDTFMYNKNYILTKGLSRPYIIKVAVNRYDVSYEGFMKIMSVIAYHMKS